eukprot:CAMPEP_0116893002 /NCGR_PEP_ID=MMETSP0467-20121206/3091_1 /TAXON_ID=283647 /ORGANISM="Mesodinium pulex, Strain SPMC105" /LENGTH=46 /DNA_ID= /DNA_START= /DNA_END= /DNA_ORIENTATION=
MDLQIRLNKRSQECSRMESRLAELQQFIEEGRESKIESDYYKLKSN